MASGTARNPSSSSARAVASAGGDTDGIGELGGQQVAGGDLGVERLGGRHAHLHVTTVGGVQHAVGTIGEVAVASVDDGDHRRATRPHEVDRAIGVGRRAALAHGDHERVGHVISQLEPGELRGQHALGAHVGARGERAHRLDESPTGDGCGALTDHQQAGDRPVGDAGPDRRWDDVVAEVDPEALGAVEQLAAEGLAKRPGGFADLLQEVVRRVPPIDVPGGDLGHHEVSERTGISVPS